jgi:hypothetical protein
MTYEPLQFLPKGFLRWIGLAFTRDSLRYFLLPLVTLGLAILATSLYVQDIYYLNSYPAALRYLIASLFSVSYPFLKIEKGQMVLEEGEIHPMAAIGGPGNILVSPGNAVLFERLKHPSNVRGQGLHFISRFESIKQIVDLTDLHGYVEKTSAMSKDGIVVTVHDVNFRYRLWGGPHSSGNTGRSQTEPYPYSVQAIRKMVYNRTIRGNGELVAWEAVVQGTLEGEILSYIRANLLDAVTAPTSEIDPTTGQKKKDPRQKIREKLFSPEIKKRFRDIGAELFWFDIGHFSFEDPAVEEQRIRTWSAGWIGAGDQLRAEGSSLREAYIEMGQAQVQAELVMALVNALHDAGLSGELRGEAMQKLVLVKTAQLVESMSGVYEPSPYGE